MGKSKLILIALMHLWRYLLSTIEIFKMLSIIHLLINCFQTAKKNLTLVNAKKSRLL